MVNINLQLNDELIEINGQKITRVTIPEIKNILKQEGKQVKLKVKRANEEKEYTLALRSLID